jgi:hypothetical protein
MRLINLLTRSIKLLLLSIKIELLSRRYSRSTRLIRRYNTLAKTILDKRRKLQKELEAI